MREYIEIPLTTREIIMSLSCEQAGELFGAIFDFIFDNVEPDFSDDLELKNAFVNVIRKCRKITENGMICHTETFENYEVNNGI